LYIIALEHNVHRIHVFEVEQVKELAAALTSKIYRLVAIGLLGLKFGSCVDFGWAITIPDGPLSVWHMKAILEAFTNSPFAGCIFHLHLKMTLLEFELLHAKEQLLSALSEYLNTTFGLIDNNFHVAMLHESVVVHVKSVVVFF